VLHLRPHVLAKDDAGRAAVVYISRPRGYFGAGRDIVEMMDLAIALPAGVPTISTSKFTLKNDSLKAISGRFNDERITARVWPLAENRVSVIEFTY
jgi:triacylglycerol lipase